MSVKREYGNDTLEKVFQWTTTNPSQPSMPTETLPVYHDYGRYEGVKIDNFHKRKAAGELLPLNRYKRIDLQTRLSGRENIRHFDPSGQGAYDFTDSLPCFRLATPTNTWSDLIITETDLLKALDEVESSAQHFVQEAAAQVWAGWDVGTFLAELRQTINMFTLTGKNIARIAKQLREQGVSKTGKGLGRDIKRAGIGNVASSKWLEYRYGWRQVIFDLNDITEMLKRDQKRIYTARAGVDHTSENTWHHLINKAVFAADLTMKDQITVGVRGRYAALAELDLRGYLNPLLTTWEVIPFSFVVDWFIEIGTSIKALSSELIALQSTAARCFYVQIYRTVAETEFSHEPGIAINSGLHFTSKGELRLRLPAQVSFSPKMSIGDNLDLPKVVDAISLVIQNFRGK